MAHPQLPQELIDAIVDYLSDGLTLDFQTLRACSLVACPFVSPCQQRLFSSIKLYTAPHSFCVRGDVASAVQTTVKMAQLLVSSPHLGTYVKEVSIAYPKTESLFLDSAGDSDYLRALTDIFTAIPALETLSIQPRAVDWDDIWNIYTVPPELVQAIIPAPPCESLRRLELTRVHLKSLTELEDMLRLANNLRELVLRDIMIYESADGDTDSNSSGPRTPRTPEKRDVLLESLELRVVPSYFFQEALEAFQDIRTFTNLRTVCIDEYDDLILDSNAETLEEIFLIRRHGQDVHLIGRALLDLLSGPVLRELHLKLTSDLTNLHTNIQHIRDLTNTRSAFASDKSIFINLQDTGLLYELLSDIDDLFGGAHVEPGPRRVVMQLAFTGKMQEVRGWMPRLDARGVLEVVELTDAQFAAATKHYRCSECFEA
ncbi:hypothetical protein HMN09_00034800 [Mycena chlorophos]|uniref:F-box domain-containing protein n=1 Tax=Mycena chlorophos TaxID=658473 RepID=A0A8H6WPQ4_MYCCL|nr:hypothetical protein HMN09_00034800 [Mycena chlorophos]